jgi:hypothetical protein
MVILEKIFLINLPKAYFIYLFLTLIYFYSFLYKPRPEIIIFSATIYDIFINSTLGWSALYILFFIFILYKLENYIVFKTFLINLLVYMIFINGYILYINILTNFNVINLSIFRLAPYLLPQIIIQFLVFFSFTRFQKNNIFRF